MDLTIITVNTNDKEKLLEQISSVVFASQGIEYEQIISDNGSTDGSLASIRTAYPHIKIVENGKNIGFGSANNAALPFVSGEFILFLNPDMRLEHNSLGKIIAWMRENKKIGIASCKLVDEKGNPDDRAKPRRFPTLFDQLVSLCKLPHLFPRIISRYLYQDFDPEKEQEVDSVRGSFMLVRKEIVDRLGWAFDKRYFLWFEDVDICKEVWKMGYKVVYTPLIFCVDYIGQTFARQPSLQKQIWFTKSMLTYFQKWEPWYVWIWIGMARPIALFMVWLQASIKSIRNIIITK